MAGAGTQHFYHNFHFYLYPCFSYHHLYYYYHYYHYYDYFNCRNLYYYDYCFYVCSHPFFPAALTHQLASCWYSDITDNVLGKVFSRGRISSMQRPAWTIIIGGTIDAIFQRTSECPYTSFAHFCRVSRVRLHVRCPAYSSYDCSTCG